MLTRAEAIALCKKFPNVYEDYPFDDGEWTAMRHRGNKKTFAFIFEREGKIWINVKAEPMTAEFWRNVFPSVIPAYHMNKKHWISIILDGTVSDNDIHTLISESYALTKPKTNKRKLIIS